MTDALFEPRNARTDKDSGLRFYKWKGEEYPSVTTIRRMAGVPFPLMQWTVSQVVNRAVDGLGDLNRRITSDDPALKVAAKSWLRSASIEERDRAASIGKRVHAAATENTPLGQVPQDIRAYLMQYEDFLHTTGFEVLRAESQVYNLKKGYAGSFDLLGRTPKDDIAVVDIKSGKNIYPEHALQVCAYALGEFVGADDVVDEEATKWLHQATHLSLLHLSPIGWTWSDVRVDKELIVAFNGLLAYAKWAWANGKVESLIESEQAGLWMPRAVS